MYPASASGGSASVNGSTSSNGKRYVTNYHYRTINAQSEVDEPHRITIPAK
jgi:hypothetical protein